MSNDVLKTRRRSASPLLAQSITFDDTLDYAFRRDLTPHIKSCAFGPRSVNWVITSTYYHFYGNFPGLDELM